MSSTLLQKAQQALNEKIAKVLPENIKNGITMFGVTGTYSGGGGSDIIEFGAINSVTVDFSALATILNQQTSTIDRTRPILRESSGFDPCLQISGIYDKFNTTQAIRLFGISVDTHDTLGLTFGNHNVIDIYTADSETEEYFDQGMTLQDLITVFSLIGTKTIFLPLNDVGDCILYGISVIKIFFSDANFASSVHNIPSNIFTFNISQLNEIIGPDDHLNIDWSDVATIIRNSCTTEELGAYINGGASGYNPCLILSSYGKYVNDTAVYNNADLFACIGSPTWLGLSVGSDDYTEELSKDPIYEGNTEHEIPEPCTVSDLCDMLDSAGVKSHNCFVGGDYADMEYHFSQPITELRLLGQTLDKTITVDTTQYDLITINHCG